MPEFTGGPAMAGPVGMGARTAQYTGSYIVCSTRPPRRPRSRAALGCRDRRRAVCGCVGCGRNRRSARIRRDDRLRRDRRRRGRGPAGPAASARAQRPSRRTCSRWAGARRLRVRPAVTGVPEGLPRRCLITGGDSARRDTRCRSGRSRYHRRRRDPRHLGAASRPRARVLVLRCRNPVCVLDTGVDSAHPDLADRIAKTESFIVGELEDGHGHGTHCIGTAFRPKDPQTLPRYGVAYDAEVFAARC